MTNLINDVAALTSINEKLLNKIVDVIVYSVNDSVAESIMNKETVTQIDTGIGTLSILVNDNELKFKFVPNAKLRESIISTIKNEENTLTNTLEINIADRFTKLYKEIV